MIIQLDTTNSTPIYVQLRNQIVLGIGRGDLEVGAGLPTVRQLAEDVGVNVMTVNKTYAILKNEGFIEIDRRHGAKVKSTAHLTNSYREKVESELELLITESTLKGFDKQQFLGVCEHLFDALNVTYATAGGSS